MRKFTSLILIIHFSLFIINSSFAQWKTNGTLLSLPNGESNLYNIYNSRPHIATIADGSAFICWMKEYSISEDSVFVYLSAIDEQGNILPGWPAGGIVVTSKGLPWVPKVIATEDESAIVAWQGYPDGKSSSQVFMQKYSKAGVALWNEGKPITVSGVDGDNDQYPVLISDGNNGCFVTWNRFTDPSLFPNYCNVMLQHIDNTGKIASGWNTAGTAVGGQAGVYEYYPRLVLSNEKNYVYVMFTRGPLSKGNVILTKIRTSDGTFITNNLWTVNGIAVSYGPNIYSALECEQFVFADKKGNIALFWLESRSTGNGEYYMQIIDSTGAPKLGAKGKYIAGKTDSENGLMFAETVQDSDDNYLVVDNNFDNGGGAGYDIDITKVKSDGTILWQKISATTNTYSAYPKAVSDGYKGMYVFYKNLSNKKLQALAFDSLGNRYKGWPSEGVDFGEMNNKDSFNPRYDFTVSSTKKGHAVVTWNRIEIPYFNIYACNLNHNATNCVFDVTSISDLNSNIEFEVFPNPFSSSIYIRRDAINSVSNMNFKLYDVTGKLIIEKKLNNSELNALNCNSLTNGIYFYLLINENAIITKGKIIKQSAIK